MLNWRKTVERGGGLAIAVASIFGVDGDANGLRGEFVGRFGTSARPTLGEARLGVADLRPGDVLAARWADERKNTTPGYWNHLALVAADGVSVVEARESADGAILTPINEFAARYSEICVVRHYRREIAEKAARWAEGRVRTEGDSDKADVGAAPRYSRFASLAPRLREDAGTENCVSLVRRAFWVASGVDYRRATPDGFVVRERSGDFAVLGRLDVDAP